MRKPWPQALSGIAKDSRSVLFLAGAARFGCLLNRAQIHCAEPWHLEFSGLPPRSSSECPASA